MVNSYDNYEWFLGKDLSKYNGKWVALFNKKVISSGKNALNVLNEFKEKYPNQRPLLTKIKDKVSVL